MITDNVSYSCPLVSVVIPTYNSEKSLPMCLKSIKEQSYKNIEAIVVDRFSSDRSAAVARSYGVFLQQIRSERSKAKNIGLHLSRGTYVLFIDSDMILTKDLVSECVTRSKKHPDLTCIVIPERSAGKSFWVRVRDFERSFYAGSSIESARFFLKDVAISAGGYDETLISNEESTLPQRISKFVPVHTERADSHIIHLEENFQLSRWLMKKLYYGKTLKKYAEKYGAYSREQTNVARRLMLFASNRQFYKNPSLWPAVLFLKCLEYLCTVIGVVGSI